MESAQASAFSDCLILPAMVRETVALPAMVHETVVLSCSGDNHRVRNASLV